MAQLVNKWQRRNLNSKLSGSRIQVLDCYTPLPFWYVWIICWHLKIKKVKIKTQISSLSEWKVRSSNNPEFTLSCSLPLSFHGDVTSHSPHHSLLPFNTEADSHLLFVIWLALLFSYIQLSSLIYMTCLAHVDICDPSSRFFQKWCIFALIMTGVLGSTAYVRGSLLLWIVTKTRKLKENSEKINKAMMGIFKATTEESM